MNVLNSLESPDNLHRLPIVIGTKTERKTYPHLSYCKLIKSEINCRQFLRWLRLLDRNRWTQFQVIDADNWFVYSFKKQYNFFVYPISIQLLSTIDLVGFWCVALSSQMFMLMFNSIAMSYVQYNNPRETLISFESFIDCTLWSDW